MSSATHVVQVTNVSPSTTSEQMRTLFGFLGNIEELKLFPPDDSPLPVTSRVCFVKFLESESVGVSQHLTNTVFVDRALIVVPFAEGVIPDESKAMSLLAPANAVAGMMPGAGLLPTPNPLMGGGAFGGPSLEQLAAMGLSGANMTSQAISADLLKFMQSMDPKLNPLAAGLGFSPGLKSSDSNKEMEEAMKRVREAQSLISAAIQPGSKKDDRRKRSPSGSRSRRRRSRSRSRHRKRSKSRSRRRSHSRNRRRSKSPRRRASRSRDTGRRSRSRDRKKEDKSKKRSKTPPKSYSSARRSRSINRRHKRSTSRSPKRRLSPSSSPKRHKKDKKEKKGEKERKELREQSRDKAERWSSKKKSREQDGERRSDSEKEDVKVTRDYDEEEQEYNSAKEGDFEEEPGSDSDSHSSPKGGEEAETAQDHAPKKSKVNGDEHYQEDMDMSD
ncbi:uncharacterized protein [Nerophis lumbriciformis]|uniref:uncharacterized protein n=1 Tax=Nerophis lumbriciformis TaxID=546530 RepID=UPI002ADF6E55|nr:serine/arginine-rich splicing factor 11-like [Nerophis lumbriciformis]